MCGMTCFNLCTDPKYKPKTHNGSHVPEDYEKGWRGCTVCDVMIHVDPSIVRCPCCNNTMRTQPRRSGNLTSRRIRVEISAKYVRY